MAKGRAVVLACDPTLEGVLAAIGITYLAHAQAGQVRLASNHGTQPRLGELLVRAPSSLDNATMSFAQRVANGYAKRVYPHCTRRRAGDCPSGCRRPCLQRLALACASDDQGMPEVVHQYVRLGFAAGPRSKELLADERVCRLDDLARAVSRECEHTRQFVRFSRHADGTFLAVFSPAANTLPLVADHFAGRMGPERFCLVDPRHHVAAFHEAGQRGCAIVLLDAALAHELSSREDLADDELYIRALWQHFYHGTSLPGRDRSQRGYDLRTHWMPQRLWGGLTELEPPQGAAMQAPARYAEGLSGNAHDAGRVALHSPRQDP